MRDWRRLNRSSVCPACSGQVVEIGEHRYEIRLPAAGQVSSGPAGLNPSFHTLPAARAARNRQITITACLAYS